MPRTRGMCTQQLFVKFCLSRAFLEVLTLFETRSKHSLRRKSPCHPADIRLSFWTRPTGAFKPRLIESAPDYSRSMTAGAQQALRRTMEIYSNTTRFCLACNMSNKIIEPIQSRCAILRYTKLRDQEILKRLLEICEEEKVCLAFKVPCIH